jgi:hypothetical protein
VSVQEGKAAEEMMLIGSGILVKPVVQWDDQIIGSGKQNFTPEIHLAVVVWKSIILHSATESGWLLALQWLPVNFMLISFLVLTQAKKAQLLRCFSTSFLRT